MFHLNTQFKIVSGGQTGVDRAALQAAIDNQIPHGGWCPLERTAEDGIIHEKFHLEQTPSSEYQQRTNWNVRDSDATLILSSEPLAGGTKLTEAFVIQMHKPLLILDPLDPIASQKIYSWVIKNQINALNVAGPRASENATAYKNTYRIISHFCTLLTQTKQTVNGS